MMLSLKIIRRGDRLILAS